jgi:hypothetical protein
VDVNKLLEWIDAEIAKIKCHMENGFHTEKMIYHGSLVQMETLRGLVVSGYFD